MRLVILGAVVAGLLAVGIPAQTLAIGAALDPSLEESLAGSGLNKVSVIVKFADDVDLKSLRAEINRSLKEQYPDPKERKAARKAFKRSKILKALRKQARAGEQAVQDYLAGAGEPDDTKALWAINAVAVTLPASLVTGLAALPSVEEVILDAVVQSPGTGTAPTAPSDWNLHGAGAPTLWQEGHTGLGVVVATLDTGVDATHPDLGPRWRGGSGDWFDPSGQHPEPADINGHGTQVMGLIVGGAAGGYQVGMAPDAKWIAAKIFDDSNEATLSGIHLAFQWALDPDGDEATNDAPDILNNSWDLATTVNQCVQEFSPDIALLKEAEIAVVFAGGNYGPDGDSSVSPANDPAVLSVGTVDRYSDVDVLSSRGANACDGGVYPHLVAPGDGVLTTDRMPGFYNVVAGTSFAVAHVTGGMALLSSAFPDATVSQLETTLMDTAVDLGDAGPDNDSGHGLMDLVAAHDQLQAELGGGGDPGSLQFNNAAYSIDEGVASLTVTVTRTGGSAGAVSVEYGTADGLAVAGEDYQPALGILGFEDGQTSGTFGVVIVDDTVYEGDEDFQLTLGNPQGGATVGAVSVAVATILDDDPADADGDGVDDGLDRCPGTAAGASVDADGCSPGQIDSDGDGVTADLDCDDADAGVYPGAPEVSRDGIDQDCNGLDLTIRVTKALYSASPDKLLIYAKSRLNEKAALRVTVHLEGGGSVDEPLSWKKSKDRWEIKLKKVSSTYGSAPGSVTVYGPEGDVTASVEVR